MLQDFRFGLRNLLGSPGFTLAAILTLALGIGANTALFSVVNGVLLRPLPYRDPEPLVMVWEAFAARGRTRNVVAPADYLEWKARNHVFSSMSAISQGQVTLTGVGDPEDLRTEQTTANYFPLLGAQPLLGRAFSTDEDKPGAARVILLSHAVWMRKFSGDAKVVGRSIRIDGEPATVIGIMGPDFLPLREAIDVWMPLALDPARDWRKNAGRYLFSAARLKPDVSLEAAQREMAAIAASLEREYPNFSKGWGVNLVPLRDQVVGNVRLPLLVLMGAVGFVLLIACANVANLLLAKGSTRRKEMAVRASLGAGKWRIVRQLITESVILALGGASVGCLVALWSIGYLRVAAERILPRAHELGLDWTAVGFASMVALVSAVFFGAAPAFDLASLSLTAHLQEGGRSGIAGRRTHRLRNALIIAEVALSVVLLVGAGLLIQSFRKLTEVNTGFDAKNVMTMRVSLSNDRYRDPARRVQFFLDTVSELGQTPGVQSAGYVMFLPFTGPGSATSFHDAAKPKPQPGQSPVTDVRIAHSDYFRTMSIPLKHGRLFDARDLRMDARPVFVVNETLVKRMFPGQDPLGQKLVVAMGDDTPGEIIGVVGDVKHASLEEDVRPMVYYPHSKLPFGFTTFVVKSAVPEAQLSALLARVIHQKDPELAISEVRSMEGWLSRAVTLPRLQMQLLAGLSGLALFLAAIGIYSVMAFLVSMRTQEIGLRMALGATRGEMIAMVLRRGGALVGTGLLLGLVAALGVTRVLRTLLYQVETADPATYLSVGGLLALIALLACYLPARQAASVDPMVALRSE